MDDYQGMSKADVLTVGREQELRGLAGLVDRMAGGTGGAIALVGEPGIGKSHLLRALASQASTVGIELVSGRATDVGHTEAYRPLLEVMSRVLADRDEQTPYGDLVRGMLGVGGQSPQAISPTTLGEAQLHICAGCLIVFEDLHWADPDSIAAIEYVVDHAADAGIAVVLTTRNDGNQAVAMVRRAAARGSIRMFDIEPLDEEQTGRLAGVIGGSFAALSSHAIHRWSGGVPLIVTAVASDPEALQAVVNGWPTAPATFADIVVGQLARLSAHERYVLSAAALLGDRIEPATVALVADVDRSEILASLRSAVEANLVEAGGLLFTHSLTRIVMIEQLLAVERQELAERALAALPDAGPSLRARLAAEVGDAQGAAALLVEAGVAAASVGALANAEDMLRQSLALVDSETARVELVDVLAAAGKASEVIDATQHSSSFDGELGTRLALARARGLRSAGRIDDAERLLAKLSAHTSESSVGIALLAASIRLEAGDHEAASTLMKPIIDDDAISRPQRSEALCLIGRAHRAELRFDKAREAFASAVELGEGSSYHLARARFELGTIDFVEMGPSDVLEQASRDAVVAGALGLGAYADHLRIAHSLERLERPDGLDGEELLARVRRLGLGALERPMLGLLALLRAIHLDRAGVERWTAEAERHGVRDQWTALSHSSLGTLHLLLEDRATAMECFALAEEIYPSDALPFPWRRLGTLTALLEGHTVVHLPPGRPIDAAIDLAIEAVELGRLGQGGNAALSAERSFRRLDHAPRFRALLQRLVAEAAIRDGFGTPGRWLAEAIPILDASPFNALAAAAKTMASNELQPTTTVRTIPTGLAAKGVTAREMEVLELLVDGLSYNEIGERIHMSPRTVEGHVGRVRNKFDGISRVELIVAVAPSLAP